MLVNEWFLLRAICSDRGPDERREQIVNLLHSAIRWPVVLELAERHGVQPLLYQALANCEQLVPADQFLILKQNYRTNLQKGLFLSRELIRIVDALAAAGIEGMPYKGVVFAESVYGDLALRQAGDIDLLIHANDLGRIRETVRELGYTPHLALSEVEERAYLKSGYEYAFDGAAGPNLLEVQWAIQPSFYAADLDIDGLFARGKQVAVAGHAVKTLAPEDSFLVLSLHAAKHVWGRLIWLCDLARLICQPSLNWKWIGAEARALGIVRTLRVTMDLANRLLSASIPAAANEFLPEEKASEDLADEIANYVGSGKAYDVESVAYFRLMLRLRERRSDRIRFISRLVFTPGPNEWAAVRLPSALFPLYRVVRLSRVTARLLRA